MFCNQLTLFIVLAVGFAAAQKNTFSNYTAEPGSCTKNVYYANNLNFAALEGPWYVRALTNNGTSVGCDGNCWTLFLGKYQPRNLTVTFCCQQGGSGGTPFCSGATGSGSIADPNGNGILVYTNQGIAIRAFMLRAIYNDLLVGYVCYPMGNFDFIYAFSRDPNPKNFYPRLNAILAKSLISPSAYQEIKQPPAQCRYTFGCK